jgi:hypothetical protein
MTFKENKCKYADQEEEVSTAMSKKRRPFGDDGDGSDYDDDSVTPRVMDSVITFIKS